MILRLCRGFKIRIWFSKVGAILARFRRQMYPYVDHCDGCHPPFLLVNPWR